MDEVQHLNALFLFSCASVSFISSMTRVRLLRYQNASCHWEFPVMLCESELHDAS